MTDFAAQSGHWYRPDGSPRYTMVGANGKERDVTLRDARKEGLFPSVTGIIKQAAAPGLERWIRRQVALACLTLPRIEGESADDFLKRAEADSQEEGKRAAERGVAIHAAIEQFYRGEPVDKRWWPHVGAARDELALYCGEQKWLPERSYAHPMGYGCKIDLHSLEWIVDTKTREFTVNNIPEVYDEPIMQVAANRRAAGIDKARGAILFVSASVPGLAVFRQIKEDDLQRGLRMFDSLLSYWCEKNRYYPNETGKMPDLPQAVSA